MYFKLGRMLLVEKMNQKSKDMTNREEKYLTFSLSNEEYGISIMKVKEIIGMMSVTSVPQMPQFVRGVINLRGKVIPVMDMRLRFGMDEAEYTRRTCIVVVEAAEESGKDLVGTVVDSVSEVLNIKDNSIEPTPSFGSELNAECISGMAKIDQKVKILLDINKVVYWEECDVMNTLQREDQITPAETPLEQSVQ